MKALIVIGLNYGDEGKGLITDYLSRIYSPAYVSRFNGGAQAGHTVVTSTGTRHVFSHFGAGTLAKCDTNLTKDFIVNPFLLDTETRILAPKIDHCASIYVHPEAKVTTLFDVAINALSAKSQMLWHGTCGVGINETVTRSLAGYPLRVIDFFNGTAENIIKNIHQEWVPARIAALGLSDILMKDLNETTRVLSTAYTDYHAQYYRMDTLLKYIKLNHQLPSASVLLYEGAQGLALDEYLGVFPHVTRSVTGLPNAVISAIESGATTIHPIYVTRAYMTRHGAGPLLHEGEYITNTPLTDDTNVYNEWQGKFRYAPLNLLAMRNYIYRDLDRTKTIPLPENVSILSPTIAVTCIDKLGDKVGMYNTRNTYRLVSKTDLTTYIGTELGYPVAYGGHGPSADLVRTY